MSSNNPGGSDSFAALFEQQSRTPARGRAIRVGDRLEGVVVKVGRDAVFVELDGKRQAYMDAAEVRAPDGTVTVKVGDTIAAHVVEVDARTGNVRIGRSMGRPGSLAAIEQARDAGVAIEGKVTAVNKGGLEVDLDGTRAFCPISQADNRFVQDPNAFLGRTLQFLVTDIREGGKNVVLSRRALLEREARDAAARLLRDLAPGAVVRGTVTGVREFGAFVDLGGVEGLIPASEVSHDRSVAVGDALEAGDVVEVQVREVKPVTPQRQGDQTVKITLSLKALAADPWDQIDTVLSEGKVTLGSVTRLADFGAFVRLAAGVEGLLHVSELGARVEHPSKVLEVGQSLPVVVRRIDKDNRKISLVPAPEGVGVGAMVQGPSFGIGTVVTAAVERVESFGVFVQIEGTSGRAGRGLIPNAELGVPRGTDVRKHFPEGTRVTAKVLETGEGRLRLSIRAAREDEERAHFDGYRDKVAAPKKLGTLGDLLKKKGL
jgi:small subunit ribosomal protein S1